MIAIYFVASDKGISTFESLPCIPFVSIDRAKSVGTGYKNKNWTNLYIINETKVAKTCLYLKYKKEKEKTQVPKI